MVKRNIEIQNAKQTIALLKSYATAKTQKKKDTLLQQIRSVNLWAHILLTQKNYEPMDLATKIEKAIQLNQYRPKNMSIVQLAKSDDLNHIGGEFDTFDIKLNKMMKDKESPEKIRDLFKGGTANVYILAKQFSADWIRRLNKHKNLVATARNANETNIIKAYDDLFMALAKDFSKEYDIQISTKVVTDWATSTIKPKDDWEKIQGLQLVSTGFMHKKGMSDTEKQKLIEECVKNPEKHKISRIRINITNIKEANQNPDDFFYSMISIFAHEIHHALDLLKPREGALGPQISLIDNKTYTNISVNKQAYQESATEISSYAIEETLRDYLKNIRF